MYNHTRHKYNLTFNRRHHRLRVYACAKANLSRYSRPTCRFDSVANLNHNAVTHSNNEVNQMNVRLLLLLLLLASVCVSAQDIHWHVLTAPAPSPAPTFWSVGRWDRLPLRTSAQTLKSPWFIAPWAAATTATIVDIRRNRNLPDVPHGGELYVDSLVPLGVCIPLGYLSDRFITRPISVGIATYFIARHTRGAITRQYP